MDSPVGVRAGRDPPVHGRAAARSALRCTTPAPTPSSTAFVQDVEKIVRQQGAIFGEYPEYEPGSYTFLADYLPYASGDGMEHRNSTVMTVAGVDRERPRAICSTRSRTSSSTAGTSSASGRGRSSRSTSSARTCRASCGSREGFTQYYGPLTLQRARLVDLRGDRRRRFGRLDRDGRAEPGRLGALGRRDEPDGAVHRRRPHGRSDELVEHDHLLLPVRRRDCARARSHAARPQRRPRHARRLHARDVAHARQARRQPRGLRRSSRTRSPTPRRRWPRSAATRAFAREFFARYIQGHEVADYARLLARAGFAVRRRNAGRAWLGDLQLESRGRRACRGAGGADVADLRGGPRSGRRAAADRWTARSTARATSRPSLRAAQARRHRVRSCSSIAPGPRGPARVTLAEDPHLEVVPAEHGGTLTAAQKTFRDRWLGAK